MKKLGLIVTALFAVLLILQFQGILKNWDWALQDVWYQEERAVDSRIAILAVDDASLQEIGQWPWARDVHAELVNKLSEGNPAVIGFDITFPLPSTDPADDKAFIDAIDKAGNVVLAQYGQFDRYAKRGMIESLELSEPFPALKDAASGLGHLNTMPDADGVVRQALYQFSYNGEVKDSFSAVIARAYAERQGEKLEIDEAALNDYRQFHIHYAGKPEDFEVIPYAMVLNGQVSPAYFENRIVLIGPYTVGIKDDFLTPMSSKQNMYGVEIHANIIQNLLEEDFKKELAFGWQALILGIAAVIAFAICRLQSPVLALIVFLVAAAIFLFSGKILYQNGFIISLIYVLLLFALAYISSVALHYILELAERKRVTSIFGRYVAPQVVSQILEQGEEGLKLGGTRKEITVVFVDIRGFTTLSESIEPEEIVAILNEYLNLTASCIFENGGTLDKFIGDATMAIFNAPLPLDDHEMQAVKTAWAMKQGSIALEQKLEERFGKSVKFGIGIHTGPAVVGNIGSANHMDYTAIGDTVNTAARLESSTKPGQIVMSDAVYEKVKDRIEVTSLGEIHVKGKAQGINIYELEGLK